MSLEPEVLFVNSDYIKRYTWLNGSVDENLMFPAIYLAQDEYIQQYLGEDLFKLIKQEIKDDDVTIENQILLDEYIRRATCWWSLYELLPHLYMKTDNGSIVIRESDDTTQIAPEDLFRYRDQTKDKALFYTKRMVQYLFNNSTLYPAYSTNESNGIWAEKEVYESNAWMISEGRTQIPRFPKCWFK
jgi:hypothetical protein